MSSIANQRSGALARAGDQYLIGNRNFDWIMTGLSAWVTGGIYLDGWAHLHGKVDESFFTPWHGILYAGLLAVIIFLGIHLYRDRRPDTPWLKVLPAGYTLSLVGAGLFAVGGLADLVWHTLFGIELSVEATISPTHLILAFGALLIVTGPLRSMWTSLAERANTFGTVLPMLLSLTFAFSILTFFTVYVHPLVDAWSTSATARGHEINLNSELDVFVGQALGAASVLLQSGILMGTVFIATRRSVLPFGSFTLVFALNAALMSVLHDRYNVIPGAVIAGLAADGLYSWLKPSGERLLAMIAFAFLVPATYFGLYFLLLYLTEPLWWSVHMVVGTTVLAGCVGALIGYTLHSFSVQQRQPA